MGGGPDPKPTPFPLELRDPRFLGVGRIPCTWRLAMGPVEEGRTWCEEGVRNGPLEFRQFPSFFWRRTPMKSWKWRSPRSQPLEEHGHPVIHSRPDGLPRNQGDFVQLDGLLSTHRPTWPPQGPDPRTPVELRLVGRAPARFFRFYASLLVRWW